MQDEAFEQSKRFRYLLKTDRINEYKTLLRQQFGQSQSYSIDSILHFLKMQGYHLEEKELIKISEKIFKEKGKDVFTQNQVIALRSRLSVDDQVEKEIRKVFDFFNPKDDKLTTADLKSGFSRLGETIKERDVDLIFLDLDLNGQGYVEFEQFLQAFISK